jgi:ATP-dependent Clp protease ATP-binding subunit ClpC
MTVIVEPITDRGQQVLTLAAQDAKRRGHGSIRREHVLLAILGEGGGVACRVLRDLAVDPVTLSADLEKRLQPEPPIDQASAEAASDQLPPGLLNDAAAEARGLGHRYVGTEHLLVAMTRAERTPAAEVHTAHGVTAAAAVAVTARLLGRQLSTAAGENP